MTEWAPAAGWSPLPAGTLDLWRIELGASTPEWGILRPEEEAAARRIVIPGKRDQKAAARAGLRRILGRYLGVDPRAVRLAVGEHGKPELVGEPQLAFNLSHSEHLALVGLCRGARIGVDIEHRRPGRAFEAIAARFFSSREDSALLALAPAARPLAFYRAWTLKEAYLKAWGTGLSFSSRRFTIDAPLDGPARLIATEMPGDSPTRWTFVDVDVGEEFCGAVCLDLDPPSRRQFRLGS